MTQEQARAKAHIIRKMITGIIIAEYALIELVDGTKQDLKVRVKNAIASCRRVQDWFLGHPDASPEIKAQFKRDFVGSEIVLLTELLESTFGMSEEGIEEVIRAVKEAQHA